MRYFEIETNVTFLVEAEDEETALRDLEAGSFSFEDVANIVVLNIIETDDAGDPLDGEDEEDFCNPRCKEEVSMTELTTAQIAEVAGLVEAAYRDAVKTWPSLSLSYMQEQAKLILSGQKPTGGPGVFLEFALRRFRVETDDVGEEDEDGSLR